MFITSFSAKGYKEYGKQFLDSYLKNCKIPLVVYTEEPMLDREGVEFRNMWNIPGIVDFLQAVDVPEYRGEIDMPNSYTQNVHKFARKTFVIEHALRNCKEKAAWIDADCTVDKPVPNEYLENLIPDECHKVFLGREDMHSECGFIGFNCNNRLHELFLHTYLSIYTSGAFQNMMTKCDSSVFDFARLLVNAYDLNIGEGLDPVHPFSESVLSEYFTHNKGNRKRKSYARANNWA